MPSPRLRRVDTPLILCDEVSDVSNKEQVSIVIRFVDSNCIREDFILTERVTGEVLAYNNY